MSPEDAIKIKAEGVDAIQVSNHGGRQLDSAIAACLLYTSPSPRDRSLSRMPSSA